MHLDPHRLTHQIQACWLGKNIGGTLGGPHEGRAEILQLDFYDPVPAGVLPNDDLDLQLVWLHHLLAHGHRQVTPDILAEAWHRHVFFPFDEYALVRRNTYYGLTGPQRGAYDNYFGEAMGAAIRSEIWACVAPGEPARAAGLAWADAVVDHCGDGVWAEIFHAALQSAAFVESDRDRLLDTALGFLPADSRLKQALQATRRWCGELADWRETRRRIVAAYGTRNFTDVVCNLCFELVGWYYGRGDFGASICLAVNCGLDTDCNPSTLGALLGILDPDSIPERWRAPIGDQVVVSARIVDLRAPRTLAELTAQTLRLREQLAGFAAPLGPVLARTAAACGGRTVPGLTIEAEEADAASAAVIRQFHPPVAGPWRRIVRGGHWWRLRAEEFGGEAKVFRLRFRVEQPHPVKLMVYYLPGVTAWVDGRNYVTLTDADVDSDPFIAPSFHRARKAAQTFDFVHLGLGLHELYIACVRPPAGAAGDLVFGLADAASNFWLPEAFLRFDRPSAGCTIELEPAAPEPARAVAV